MNKRVKQVIIILLLIFLLYIVYFIISDSVRVSQLNAVEGNSDFPTSDVFNIKENNITAQSVIYNKGDLIEYDFCIDSLYIIHIVKIGKIRDDINFWNLIKFIPKDKSSINKSFNLVSIPPLLPTDYVDFLSFYDVNLLPHMDVENINIYLNGEMISKDTITDYVLSYSIKASSISYSFNSFERENMKSISKHSSNPTISKLVFYKSIDGNLYIMNISTNNENTINIANLLKL